MAVRKMARKSITASALSTAITLMFAAPHLALAQQDKAKEEKDERMGATEVVVTATKRAEKAQEVAGSITALDEKSLEMGGIVDPTRLTLVVPGLVMGYSGGEARPAMRGSRTNNVGVTANQVVGIFNDGVYAATTGEVLASYLDVNRIEVLRGPQGTLYGRNTFSGAINIVSNEPSFGSSEGNVQTLLGTYSRVRGQGTFNIPVSDTFALRVALMGEQHDGYIKNLYREGPSDDLRDENVRVARVTGKWKVSPQLDVTLRATKYDQDVNSTAIWGYTQIGCYYNPGDSRTSTGMSANAIYRSGNCFMPGPDSKGTPVGGAAAYDDKGPYLVGRDGPSRSLSDGTGLNFQANYNLGPATATVIAAQDKFVGIAYYDPDYSVGYMGANSRSNGFAGYDNDQVSRSLEVRLASNGNDALQWLLGAYYFKQTANWDFGYLDNGVYKRYGNATDNYISSSKAVFGNAVYKVTPTTRVNVGLRTNDDKQELAGGANGGGGDKTLYKVGLEHDLNKSQLLYGSVSTGYRVGGVNSATLVKAGAPASYGPESVTALEVGLKNQFFNRELTLNAAVFNNRYRDMHAQSFVTACVDPNVPASCIASEFTANGGEIDAKGVELEFNWLPGKQFFLNGSVSLLDAKFGDYLVGRLNGLGNFQGRQDVTRTVGELKAAGASPSLQLSGWRPALSPQFTASAQAGYVMKLANGQSVTPMVQLYHSGKYWSFDYNVPGSEQKAFNKLDLRVTWRKPSSGLSVEGFIENATNEAVLTRSVIFNPGTAVKQTASIQANYADPRIAGIRISYDF